MHPFVLPGLDKTALLSLLALLNSGCHMGLCSNFNFDHVIVICCGLERQGSGLLSTRPGRVQGLHPSYVLQWLIHSLDLQGRRAWRTQLC